jgi:2-oxo-4-hydroxy-4-carboxy-5-ureidoimidazoline decarboxylase
MSLDDFVAKFGGVYEHSAWIAEELYRRGLSPHEDTPEGLAAALSRVIADADRAAKIALIRAHPELAGRAAIAGDLTDASRSEQAGAGLDRSTPEEYRRFQELNDRYKAKFGFPFIIAVAGKSRQDILDSFEKRIGNDPETEFATALGEIDRIARFRLQKMAL